MTLRKNRILITAIQRVIVSVILTVIQSEKIKILLKMPQFFKFTIQSQMSS
jgi:hypothetical protein